MTAHESSRNPRPSAAGPTAQSILHITNGDSTRLSLEQSALPGTFQPWRDVLYDGPVPTHLPIAEFRRIRSAFIASGGFSDPATIARGYEEEDAAVESWESRDETVLWFEHDLYDQLLLIRLLSMLPPDAGRKVSLVCPATYLGMLPPSVFPALFANRRPITPEQIALARRAWHAYGDDTPIALRRVLETDTTALPFLDGALRRLFQEYPDEYGLSRTERQILTTLQAESLPWRALFKASNAMEERMFMGDWTFRGVLDDLARGTAPLVEIFRLKPEATGPDSRGFRLQAEDPIKAEDSVTLTGAGRDVLAGRADRIALNGIDRWLGGVRLTPERPWRRTI
jgi:hypothetical protein